MWGIAILDAVPRAVAPEGVGTVGPPNGSDVVTTKGFWKVIEMIAHVAGKRNGEIETERHIRDRILEIILPHHFHDIADIRNLIFYKSL